MRSVVLIATLVVSFPAFFAPSALARRCETVRQLALEREAAQTPGPAKILMQPRPDVVGALDSATIPVRVHWQAAEFEDRASEVLALVEDAWGRQVTSQGYRAPLPDEGEGGDARLDVYLVNSPQIAGLTLASDDVDDSDGTHAAYVHMLVNATLPAEELAVTVHHEFAHAIHFATDRSESLMLFESSATWQEVHAVPTSTLWTDNVEAFQSSPNAPWSTNGIDWRLVIGEDTFLEYGAVLFVMYLEEELGTDDGALLHELWQGTIQADDVEENEPDWLDVLEQRLVDDGQTRASLITDFGAWRYLVGPWRIAGRGPAMVDALGPEDVVNEQHLASALLDGRQLRIFAEDRLFPTGCTWLSATAPAAEPLEVLFQAESARADAPNDIAMISIHGTPGADVDDSLAAVFGRAVEATVSLAAGETAAVGICDLTPLDADELGLPHEVSVTARDTSLPEPVPDAEPEAEPGPVDGGTAGPDVVPPVCGCQTARGSGGKGGLPGGGPWGALKPYLAVVGIIGGAFMFFVRFRRNARGRKSIKGSNWREQRDASVTKDDSKPDGQ